MILLRYLISHFESFFTVIFLSFIFVMIEFIYTLSVVNGKTWYNVQLCLSLSLCCS